MKFFFVFVFAKPGRLVDLCLFQSTTVVMASGLPVPFVTNWISGRERTAIENDQSLRKNAAGHGHRTRDRPHTKWTHAHPNELPRRACNTRLHTRPCLAIEISVYVQKISCCYAIIELIMIWFNNTKWATAQKRQNDLFIQRWLKWAWASDQSSRWPHEETTHRAPGEDSDQTRRMSRLIWVFVGGSQIVNFVRVPQNLFCLNICLIFKPTKCIR